MPETAVQRLAAALWQGRRLTKREIVLELGILNAGGRVKDLRDTDRLPIVTVWLNKHTLAPLPGEDGKPKAWTPFTCAALEGIGHTGQMPNAIAAYQLGCRACGETRPERLGWRPVPGGAPGQWNLRGHEYEAWHLCVQCLADKRCERGEGEELEAPAAVPKPQRARDAAPEPAPLEEGRAPVQRTLFAVAP